MENFERERPDREPQGVRSGKERWRNAGKIAGIAGLAVLAAITIFHIVHHFLYCRYRGVPGKSHCAVCGHRRACQKYHHRH